VDFRVRRFRLSDLDGLLGLELEAFGRDAYDRNLFAEYARLCGDFFLVAESMAPRRFAGYSIACICRARPEVANLISIAVVAELRGKGAASLLLSSTIRRLKLRGVERLTLMVRESNATAIGFYESHGFEMLRRAPKYYENFEDGWLMRRGL
jgi:[ribosomal protein S18]-alanine N-acetyltransferase